MLPRRAEERGAAHAGEPRWSIGTSRRRKDRAILGGMAANEEHVARDGPLKRLRLALVVAVALLAAGVVALFVLRHGTTGRTIATDTAAGHVGLRREAGA